VHIRHVMGADIGLN